MGFCNTCLLCRRDIEINYVLQDEHWGKIWEQIKASKNELGIPVVPDETHGRCLCLDCGQTWFAKLYGHKFDMRHLNLNPNKYQLNCETGRKDGYKLGMLWGGEQLANYLSNEWSKPNTDDPSSPCYLDPNGVWVVTDVKFATTGVTPPPSDGVQWGRNANGLQTKTETITVPAPNQKHRISFMDDPLHPLAIVDGQWRLRAEAEALLKEQQQSA